MLDSVEGLTTAVEENLSARVEVEDLMRQIGLTEHDGDVDPHPVPKIELQMASANGIDRTDL